MKNLLFIIAASLTLFLYGCSDDDNNPVNPSGNTITLSGTVRNYPAGERLVASGEVSPGVTFGQDTIETDGVMNLTMSAPSSSLLASIDDLLGAGYIISDSSAMVTAVNDITCRTVTGAGVERGTIYRRNFDTNSVSVGSAFVLYIFSDKNVSVTGSTREINGQDTSVNNVTLNLASGWNTVSVTATALRADYTELAVTNGEASGVFWYFDPSGSTSQFNNWLKRD